MGKEELFAYIRDCRAHHFTDDQIKVRLLDSGYNEISVDDAFLTIDSDDAQVPLPNIETPGTSHKAKAIVFLLVLAAMGVVFAVAATHFMGQTAPERTVETPQVLNGASGVQVPTDESIPPITTAGPPAQNLANPAIPTPAQTGSTQPPRTYYGGGGGGGGGGSSSGGSSNTNNPPAYQLPASYQYCADYGCLMSYASSCAPAIHTNAQAVIDMFDWESSTTLIVRIQGYNGSTCQVQFETQNEQIMFYQEYYDSLLAEGLTDAEILAAEDEINQNLITTTERFTYCHSTTAEITAMIEPWTYRKISLDDFPLSCEGAMFP